MPKIFLIGLRVEEIALGPVLSKVHDMAGVVGVDLDLGHGGQGGGRKQLEAATKERSESAEQKTIKFLLQGSKHIGEISQHLGGKKSRAYGAVHQLKRKGLVEAGEGAGMHQLTHKARTAMGSVLALPAPQVSHGPAGRATPGSGNIVLRAALDGGALAPTDLRKQLAAQGMSPKSVSGVIDRAKRDSLIKKNGSGYELTAKGRKIEMGAQAHG